MNRRPLTINIPGMPTAPLSSTRYSWKLLRAGSLWLDGGSMFGVVPRVVWGRHVKSDERGRIRLGHNCLLLKNADRAGAGYVLIEAGSGDKFDAKNRDIFGLDDNTVEKAVASAGVAPGDVAHAVVTHLHFDHVGGLTRRARPEDVGVRAFEADGGSVVATFPRAAVHVQRREWEDALANNSVMTRTYLRENLDPLRDRLALADGAAPFPPGAHVGKDSLPDTEAVDRLVELLPGVFGLIVPGHTWGQQAVLFTDDRGQTVVFSPDVIPTLHHVGAAYNMAYDVEPFVSTVSRRWFLDAAVKHQWMLVLDHEPDHPVQRVEPDGRGWYKLVQGGDGG